MKSIILLLMASWFTIDLNAQAPKGEAKAGTNFGLKVVNTNAVSINELTTLLANKDVTDVKVIGKVADVCQARGCFMYLESSIGNIYIKTKDDSFFVPLALNGKSVVIDGIAGKDKNEFYILAKGILVL
jgi:hypothetical protein